MLLSRDPLLLPKAANLLYEVVRSQYEMFGKIYVCEDRAHADQVLEWINPSLAYVLVIVGVQEIARTEALMERSRAAFLCRKSKDGIEYVLLRHISKLDRRFFSFTLHEALT